MEKTKTLPCKTFLKFWEIQQTMRSTLMEKPLGLAHSIQVWLVAVVAQVLARQREPFLPGRITCSQFPWQGKLKLNWKQRFQKELTYYLQSMVFTMNRILSLAITSLEAHYFGMAALSWNPQIQYDYDIK